MRFLGPAIACLALWLGARAVVRAEPVVQPALAIELHGEVPFARSELEDALLPRLRDAAIETRAAAHGAVAHVTAQDGDVLVQIDPHQRSVPLGERTGAAAARVVALVILDLLASDGPALPIPLVPVPAAASDPGPDARSDAPSAIQPVTEPDTRPDIFSDVKPETRPGTKPDTAPDTALAHAAGRAGAQPVPAATHAPAYEQQRITPMPRVPPPAPLPPTVSARPAPAPATHQVAPGATSRASVAGEEAWHARVSVFGGVVRGASSDDAGLTSVGADARVGLGAWRAGAGVAWVHLPVTDYGQTELGLQAMSVRVDAGRALGGLELTATALVMPYRLRAGVDSGASLLTQHDSVLFGGGAAARAAAELGRGWRLEATVGIDVFGRRLRVRTPDEVLASTPAVALTIQAGLSWEVFP